MRSYRFSFLILATLMFFSAVRARAENPAREFLMSCTYGVLAGTLVGAASLAFTQKPSENMNIVARGASIGLYSGILLGLYVVYVVPGLEPEIEEDPIVGKGPPLIIVPTFRADHQLDGLIVESTILRF